MTLFDISTDDRRLRLIVDEADLSGPRRIQGDPDGDRAGAGRRRGGHPHHPPRGPAGADVPGQPAAGRGHQRGRAPPTSSRPRRRTGSATSSTPAVWRCSATRISTTPTSCPTTPSAIRPRTTASTRSPTRTPPGVLARERHPERRPAATHRVRPGPRPGGHVIPLPGAPRGGARLPYHIEYGGWMDFQYASDVARIVIASARAEPGGCDVYNLHGSVATVASFVEAIVGPPTSRGSPVAPTNCPSPAASTTAPSRRDWAQCRGAPSPRAWRNRRLVPGGDGRRPPPAPAVADPAPLRGPPASGSAPPSRTKLGPDSVQILDDREE